MRIEEILSRLEHVRKSASGWTACCPAHEDKDPSLSVTEGDDGRILVNCFAGCSVENICAALNIRLSDLFANKNGNAPQAAPPKAAPPKAKPAEHTPFQGTEEMVQEMRVALARSRECLDYICGRGVSLKVAADLKWGFSPSWSFKDDEDNIVDRPALSTPHYADSKLVGIKYRTVDGTKLFSQQKGSTIDGLYGRGTLDPKATEVSVFEGPEDTALAISHGVNAVGLIAAGSKLAKDDLRVLCGYERCYLIGDQDTAGQKSMDALQQRLPAEKAIRVRMPGFKDIGEFWKSDPAQFADKLRRILRFAQGSRDCFEWADLLDEIEISEAQGVDRYAIDKLVPCNAISMFFGEEKSGKSLLSRYMGKCVANGSKVFGKYATTKMPVLCLDLENDSQDLRAFTRHFARLGPEKIRYRTRRTGCPALDSPALLRLCERWHPLIIIDSMTKFLNGADPYHPGDMSVFFDKLLNLCAAGATIVLIHHAIRSDVERYADSHQIGANVARAFAVVSEDRPRLNRVRLEGQLFRGSEPVSENLIAFPLIADRGEFGLSSDSDPFAADLEALINFVKSQPGEACRKEAIKNRPGRRSTANLKLLDLAIERGKLAVRTDRKISFPNAGTVSSEVIPFPSQGTDGNGNDEN